ncbi:MAG TPA: site-specific integrase, partial [Terriglobales bacterium]|nr:site-specific integrase [Terriglobales bacterium]
QTSIQDAKERWERHLKPVFGSTAATRVTDEKLEDYASARVSAGAAKATVNRELSLLRFAFNLARKKRKLQFVPCFPMFKENNIRTGFVEDSQYDKLAAACAKRGLWLRAMFETGYQFGWRSGEIKTMRVRQVDLAAKTLRLEPLTTKNDEGREAVMPTVLYNLIQQCATGKSPDDYLFTRDRQQHIVRDFRGAWEESTKEAGVPDLLFHDLRRTAVRNMVRRGIPERVAMKITGHKTRAVFDRYHIVSTTDLREAAVKMAEPVPSLTIDTQQSREAKSSQPN